MGSKKTQHSQRFCPSRELPGMMGSLHWGHQGCRTVLEKPMHPLEAFQNILHP